jgi:hypothetical protein
MARQGIGTGTTPNDGTGDSLQSGAIKINENFSEVYSQIGNGTTLGVGVTFDGLHIVSGVTTLGTTTATNLTVQQINASGVSTVGFITSSNSSTAGVSTAFNGFISAASTTAVQITLSGSTLIFTASGIGSTSFTLS